LAIEVTPSDCGAVSRDLDREVYPAGTNVALTAEAALGCAFKEWKGAASGRAETVSVAVAGHIKVTAVFEKTDDLTMVAVKGGAFTMGCTPEQEGECDADDEKPVRSVTVGDFHIGKHEVTQRLWQQVMGDNPSNNKGGDLPVEQVSWNDIAKFIEELNKRTGKRYRLPTEAEWEYAARGGDKSRGYKYSGGDNIDEVAWYGGNSGGKMQSVGTKSANELGIHDMSGNALEWVNDWYGKYTGGEYTDPAGPPSGSIRVYRGGSWFGNAEGSRISFRTGNYPDDKHGDLGFRLALSP
jgi:formylglycine-generating enzyme required for sulfatase activity